MKNLSLTIVLLLLLGFQQVTAQVEFSVTINTSSGVHTKIDSIPGVKWIALMPSFSTYDRVNKRYFFRGADAAMNWGLYSLDAVTGNVLASPPFPFLSNLQDNVIELQYNNGNGILYGLHWDAGMDTEFLVSINPATGHHTIIDSIPGVKWISSGYTTFDHVNGRYIFKGADAAMTPALYSIDVATGNVVSSPTFPPLPDQFDIIRDLEYNSTNGLLYGMYWDFSALQGYLITINPTTCIHTVIAAIPGVNAVATGTSTLDQINGRYIFKGSDASGIDKLYSINIANGNVVSSPLFPVLDDPQDNVIELHFDNTTGILRALHWDANLVLGLNDLQPDDTQIYPNPFQDELTIEFEEMKALVSIKLFDAKGRLVREIKEQGTKKIEIEKGDMEAGVYYLHLSTDRVNSLRTVVVE